MFEGEKILQTLLSNANISSAPAAAPFPSIAPANGFKSNGSLLPGSMSHQVANGSTALMDSEVSVSGGSIGKDVASACKVLGISEEAAQILDELPILSFLRSNLL